jgi:hypothetical protein
LGAKAFKDDKSERRELDGSELEALAASVPHLSIDAILAHPRLAEARRAYIERHLPEYAQSFPNGRREVELSAPAARERFRFESEARGLSPAWRLGKPSGLVDRWEGAHLVTRQGDLSLSAKPARRGP